jgi:hypothetical protein
MRAKLRTGGAMFLYYTLSRKICGEEGSYTELKPFCDAITERGIGATIEVIAGD